MCGWLFRVGMCLGVIFQYLPVQAEERILNSYVYYFLENKENNEKYLHIQVIDKQEVRLDQAIAYSDKGEKYFLTHDQNPSVWWGVLGPYTSGSKEVKFWIQSDDFLLNHSYKSPQTTVLLNEKVQRKGSVDRVEGNLISSISFFPPTIPKPQEPIQVRIALIKPGLASIIKKAMVRYTVDSWKTQREAPFVLNESNEWDAMIGAFPNETEGEYLVGVQREGKDIEWAKNGDENFQFKVGQSGYTPEMKDAENKIERLSRMPSRDLDNYPMVQNFLKKHKVYISLTSSPKRLSMVPYVLRTLNLEHIEEVFLALPIRSGYGKPDEKGIGEMYDQNIINKVTKFSPKVKILKIEKDLGPISKLIPAVEYVKQQGDLNAIVITVDDDSGYPWGAMNELIFSAVLNENSVVAASAQDLPFWKISSYGFPYVHDARGFFTCGTSEFSNCNIIEGFGGVAYRVGFVNTDLMKHLIATDSGRSCFASDDLVISYALAKEGVIAKKIRNHFYALNAGGVQQFLYGFGSDALHHGAQLQGGEAELSGDINDQKYATCYKKMTEAELAQRLYEDRKQRAAIGLSP
jgi:hypothetical protein